MTFGSPLTAGPGIVAPPSLLGTRTASTGGGIPGSPFDTSTLAGLFIRTQFDPVTTGSFTITVTFTDSRGLSTTPVAARKIWYLGVAGSGGAVATTYFRVLGAQAAISIGEVSIVGSTITATAYGLTAALGNVVGPVDVGQAGSPLTVGQYNAGAVAGLQVYQFTNYVGPILLYTHSTAGSTYRLYVDDPNTLVGGQPAQMGGWSGIVGAAAGVSGASQTPLWVPPVGVGNALGNPARLMLDVTAAASGLFYSAMALDPNVY